MVHGICESEVNDAYLAFLLILRKKFEYADTDAARETLAINALRPELEKLRVKAIEKIREFLLLKIFLLGKPKTNFQILQQNVLLKYKHLLQFLQDYGKVGRVCCMRIGLERLREKATDMLQRFCS